MTDTVKIIDNMATFMCPECYKGKTVDVSKQKKSDTPVRVKIKCTCGHVFTTLLDKRRHFRKGLTLPGMFIHYLGQKEVSREKMVVLDLSISGIKFSLHEKFNMEIGDKFQIVFNLNDKERSLVKKEVLVKHINGLDIGAEFCSKQMDEMIETFLKSRKRK